MTSRPPSKALKERKRRARAGMTADEILKLVPVETNSNTGGLINLCECTIEDCKRAKSGSQGYCSKHLIDLYLDGEIDIGPEPLNDEDLWYDTKRLSMSEQPSENEDDISLAVSTQSQSSCIHSSTFTYSNSLKESYKSMPNRSHGTASGFNANSEYWRELSGSRDISRDVKLKSREFPFGTKQATNKTSKTSNNQTPNSMVRSKSLAFETNPSDPPPRKYSDFSGYSPKDRFDLSMVESDGLHSKALQSRDSRKSDLHPDLITTRPRDQNKRFSTEAAKPHVKDNSTNIKPEQPHFNPAQDTITYNQQIPQIVENFPSLTSDLSLVSGNGFSLPPSLSDTHAPSIEISAPPLERSIEELFPRFESLTSLDAETGSTNANAKANEPKNKNIVPNELANTEQFHYNPSPNTAIDIHSIPSPSQTWSDPYTPADTIIKTPESAHNQTTSQSQHNITTIPVTHQSAICDSTQYQYRPNQNTNTFTNVCDNRTVSVTSATIQIGPFADGSGSHSVDAVHNTADLDYLIDRCETSGKLEDASQFKKDMGR